MQMQYQEHHTFFFIIPVNLERSRKTQKNSLYENERQNTVTSVSCGFGHSLSTMPTNTLIFLSGMA